MAIARLALKSLLNRKFTTLLTLSSIAFSVLLLLGVERLRQQIHQNFTQTVSGTHLIVGARSSSVQLLLYSVFRMGNASNNISWESYETLASNPQVAWSIPISLGDSHQGFTVLATNSDYFKHFRYASAQALQLQQGIFFDETYGLVLGSAVAKKLAYQLGDSVVLAHGAGEVSFIHHDDKPFTVVGVLKPTGTPIDQTLHITLEAMDAIHQEEPHDALALAMQQHTHHDEHEEHGKHEPKEITAALMGLKSSLAVLTMQRYINQYKPEALTAIMPAVALQELWQLLSVLEKTLLLIASFVVIVGFLGMLTALLTSLNERRREMVILRSVGARPWHIFGLIMGEAVLLTLLGTIIGVALLYAGLFFGQPLLMNHLGVLIEISLPHYNEYILMTVIIGLGFVIGIIPSYRIYRYSLNDGMRIR